MVTYSNSNVDQTLTPSRTMGYLYYVCSVCTYIYILTFVLREHESMRAWAGEGREMERESQADSTLSTEPDVVLDPMTLGS